jgi:hypothetical protein
VFAKAFAFSSIVTSHRIFRVLLAVSSNRVLVLSFSDKVCWLVSQTANSRPLASCLLLNVCGVKKLLPEGATLVAARHLPTTYYEKQLVYCIEPDEKLRDNEEHPP